MVKEISLIWKQNIEIFENYNSFIKLLSRSGFQRLSFGWNYRYYLIGVHAVIVSKKYLNIIFFLFIYKGYFFSTTIFKVFSFGYGLWQNSLEIWWETTSTFKRVKITFQYKLLHSKLVLFIILGLRFSLYQFSNIYIYIYFIQYFHNLKI